MTRISPARPPMKKTAQEEPNAFTILGHEVFHKHQHAAFTAEGGYVKLSLLISLEGCNAFSLLGSKSVI